MTDRHCYNDITSLLNRIDWLDTDAHKKDGHAMMSSLSGIVRSNNDHQLTRTDWCGYRSISGHAVTSSLTTATATLTTSCTVPTLLRVATVCLIERTGCGYRPVNDHTITSLTVRCNVDCDNIVYYINMTVGNSIFTGEDRERKKEEEEEEEEEERRRRRRRRRREEERKKKKKGLRLVSCYNSFNVKRRGFPISVSSH